MAQFSSVCDKNLTYLIISIYVSSRNSGFGFMIVTRGRKYVYTFDNLALTIVAFIEVLEIQEFSLFIFHYGAPIGLRIALRSPDAVSAIVS
jgi:pimeloyl-ACP methyl ester carboxylesterase